MAPQPTLAIYIPPLRDAKMFTDLFLFMKRTNPFRRFFFGPYAPTKVENSIPKTIYAYWHDGIENAPDICQSCIASWKKMNPDWEVVVLNQEEANKIVDINQLCEGISQAAYSDLLRITLLAQSGGVWVDATLLCISPLDKWLPQVTLNTGFFAFSRPGPGRIIASWFLASSKDNPVSQRLFKKSLKFLQRKKSPKNYYWFHHLFEHEVMVSRHFRKQWNLMTKIPASASHILLSAFKTKVTDKLNLVQSTFVQKVTYKGGMTCDDIDYEKGQHENRKTVKH